MNPTAATPAIAENGFPHTLNGGPPPYVVPNILLGDPSSRPLKVITAGCGISGIMMAYKIQNSCKNVELVMYDKNADLGGTWFENKYPGAGCDIPCHAYSFNFALYPDWPQYCAYQKDIWKYLDKVCEVFDLRKYMKFESRITKAEWIADLGKWKMTVEQRQPDGCLKTFDDECDVFLYAVGVLNNYKYPDWKGVEKFKGKIFHSATWPADYQEEQWKNDRVAVIGSGASSIQIVTHVQPTAKKLDVFVRTGTLFSAIADNFGEYQDYTEEEKGTFRTPESLVAYVKSIEDKMSIAMDFQIAGSEMAKEVTNFFRERMREHIKDDRLLEGFTPSWDLGCRRVVPADPYMKAIQKPNVDVHFAAAVELTEDSIIDAKGVETKVDTVVCATGFDTAHRARFPIIGKDGINLAKQWEDHPEAYLGLAVPNMRNFFTFMGPAYPVHNGSIMGPLTTNGDYIIDVLQKMQHDHIKSLSPRVEITAKFNVHVQEWVKRTVWTQNCRSWFKNNGTGRITALWPGTALHYTTAIERPRYEDYDIEYLHDNPWAILGNGWSWAEKTEGVDSTPFLDVKKLDPKWVEAVFPKKLDDNELP